ncbi:RNA polymerase sigma-70 factor [Puteibacter caeruleilacunae]|nr:RNA polymerase sigma-70 factor [Puteibacter caeruleilacunae]
MQQIQEDNQIAYKMLFDRYSIRLYQFAMKYLHDKNEAEDIVHEVFLRIWEKRSSIKSNTSFQSYLFTIAYNCIRQHFLKKSREEKYKQLFAREFLIDSETDDEQVDYQEMLRKVDSIINLLPERRKEIFLLSRKEGLKNQEIADQLGLSLQFVKNQLSIARKFIVEEVKKNPTLSSLLFFYLFRGL